MHNAGCCDRQPTYWQIHTLLIHPAFTSLCLVDTQYTTVDSLGTMVCVIALVCSSE